VPRLVNNVNVIRFEPQKEWRFKPLSIKSWTQQFYTPPVDFGGGVPGSQPNVTEAPPGSQADIH